MAFNPNKAFVKRYLSVMLTLTYAQSPGRRDWGALQNVLDNLAAQESDDSWIPIMQAEVYAAQKDGFDKAEEVLQKAFDADPGQLPIAVARVELASRRGDTQAADERFESLKQAFGDVLEVRQLQARGWHAMNRSI